MGLRQSFRETKKSLSETTIVRIIGWKRFNKDVLLIEKITVEHNIIGVKTRRRARLITDKKMRYKIMEKNSTRPNNIDIA